jgi:hypothetical protein
MIYMYRPPYGLWSIWKELPVLQHLFLLVLFGVSFYSLFSASATLLSLRSIRNALPDADIAAGRRRLVTFRNQCANLQQVISVTFYLFGLVLFLGLQNVGNTAGNARFSVEALIVQNFILDFAFAANVFFIFLVLQFVIWFVNSRLNSCSEHLNAYVSSR